MRELKVNDIIYESNYNKKGEKRKCQIGLKNKNKQYTKKAQTY